MSTSNKKERLLALSLLRTGRALFNASGSSILKPFLYQAAVLPLFFSKWSSFSESLICFGVHGSNQYQEMYSFAALKECVYEFWFLTKAVDCSFPVSYTHLEPPGRTPISFAGLRFEKKKRKANIK